MPARPLPTTTLRPDPGVAAVWSAWGGLLVAAGVWFVLDSPSAPLAYLTFLVFATVAAWFVVQLAAPSVVEVRLTEDELQARVLWRRRRVPWDQVHLARVRRVLGDPILELQIRERGPSGDPWALRVTVVPLPVGADTGVLHRFLAARLGTGGLRSFDRLEPLDPT